jgi:hypothetical protein
MTAHVMSQGARHVTHATEARDAASKTLTDDAAERVQLNAQRSSSWLRMLFHCLPCDGTCGLRDCPAAKAIWTTMLTAPRSEVLLAHGPPVRLLRHYLQCRVRLKPHGGGEGRRRLSGGSQCDDFDTRGHARDPARVRWCLPHLVIEGRRARLTWATGCRMGGKVAGQLPCTSGLESESSRAPPTHPMRRPTHRRTRRAPCAPRCWRTWA